jgi:type III pantothenate kinase
MQLVIDIGNTRVKAALFLQNNLIHYFVFKNTSELLNANIIENHKVKHCILSSVVDGLDEFTKQLKQQTYVLTYTIQTPCPLKNCYESPNTLGSDRLAAAVAGNFLFPNKNVLVIDAGTCIKYNFINNRNQYIGGAISPGLIMRFKALNNFTARLPLLEVDENFNTLIATNSKDNILSGVELGAVAEINSFIDQYKQVYPNINVMLTGGDVNFFEKRLKKPIFAEPYLILKGLNSILNHNLKISHH